MSNARSTSSNVVNAMSDARSTEPTMNGLSVPRTDIMKKKIFMRKMTQVCSADKTNYPIRMFIIQLHFLEASLHIFTCTGDI